MEIISWFEVSLRELQIFPKRLRIFLEELRFFRWSIFFLVGETFLGWLKLFQGVNFFLVDCDFFSFGEGRGYSLINTHFEIILRRSMLPYI